MLKNNLININEIMNQYFNESDDLIILLDSNNRILELNPAAEDALNAHKKESLCLFCGGVTNEHGEKTCFNCFLLPEKSADGSFQIHLNNNGNIKPYSGNIVEINDRVKILTLQNIAPQIKTQKVLHQKNMTKHVIKAQEDERKRVSRELHDSIIQELINLSVDIRLMKYKDFNELEKHTQLMEGTLEHLMNEIRTLSVELRPSSLDDFGLEAALRSHFKNVEKNYGLVVELTSNLEAERLNADVETALYRIVQEAVFNAMKYAEVDEMNVTINKLDDGIEIFVRDEGKGFKKDSPAKGSGMGLYGMKERAEIIGGSIIIDSEIDVGTVVSIYVPLGGNNENNYSR